jgi:hypothetical protein
VENAEKIVLRNITIDEDSLLSVIGSLTNLDRNKLLAKIELMSESGETDLRFLEEKYNEVLQSGNDNQYFITGFKLRENMAIKINEHIYVYRIISHEQLQRNFQWHYVDQKL